MKTLTFAIGSSVFFLTLLSAQVGFSASQKQASNLPNALTQKGDLGIQTPTTFQTKGKGELLAKNSNGRRCRWVKSIGLVCDGGSFGTFNP